MILNLSTRIPHKRHKDEKVSNQWFSVITAVFCSNSVHLQKWKHFASYTINLIAMSC